MNTIINTLIVLILLPVTSFYLIGLYFISHTAFIEKTITFPIMFIYPFIGLVALWIISFRYKQYASTKIPLGIIVGLLVGVTFSIYTFSRAETPFVMFMYGSPLLLLVVIIVEIKNIQKKHA